MNARYYNNFVEFDAHNLNSILHLNATMNSFKEKMPFLISRGSFPGQLFTKIKMFIFILNRKREISKLIKIDVNL